MSYYRRSTTSSILEAFSLNPVPYPVLLILALLFLFLGIQWYVSLEDVVEATQDSMGWMLMAAPLLLLLAVRWLSAFDASEWWLWDSRPRRPYFFAPATEGPGAGASPWGVAALIVLLLVLVQYQSVFLESWFV